MIDVSPVRDRPDSTGLRIAVIGGGVAGITAAHLLQKRHRVTLFERNNYVGGHTNTIVIDRGPDEGTAVDTGFIVTNKPNYPLFQQLLKQLDVPLRDSDMSFAYYDEVSGYQYGTAQATGLIARKKNLLEYRFWSMLHGMLRLNREATREIEDGSMEAITLREYLERKRFGRSVVENYLIPMGAAIWSTSPREMLEFPATSFFHFWRNHCLLQILGRPLWQTVVGGSFQYVKAFLKNFGGEVFVDSPVTGVSRGEDVSRVHLASGESRQFDCVVIATHADEALRLLHDANEDEQRLLGAWEYSNNYTVLHNDLSFMPPAKSAWSSWNFLKFEEIGREAPVCVTYHMNRLQGLKTHHEYLVTLNSPRRVRDEYVIREINYTHPKFTFESIATQAELPSLNGQNGTYFCGSYFGYGFHEDAVRSGVDVARCFGIDFETPREKSTRRDAQTITGVAV